MRSQNLPFNPRIDQLRWLAATIVFLMHFYSEWRVLGGAALPSPWFGIISEGHTGVGLFFTLSGFLFMQIALHQKSIVYGEFMRNRFLRIFPLFFIVFLVATSIGRDKFQPQDIFYLLTTNLGNAPTSGTVVTGAAWCISLEFLFYAVFPFLARFAMERGPRYLVQLIVMLFLMKAAAYTVSENSTLMYTSTFVGRFDQFLIGMLAAMMHAHSKSALARNAMWLAPLMLLLAICNSALQASLAPYGAAPKSLFWLTWSTMESGVWAAVIVSFVSLAKAMPDWLEPILNHGGKISFSFYLLHSAVLHTLTYNMRNTAVTGITLVDAAILFGGAYAITWAVATLSYHTIEEPFLNMRRGYAAKR